MEQAAAARRALRGRRAASASGSRRWPASACSARTPEPEFDAIAALAARIGRRRVAPRSPSSTAGREWVKAALGADLADVEQRDSFGGAVVDRRRRRWSSRTRAADDRFAAQPVGGRRARRALLRRRAADAPGGLAVGTLAVIDPRAARGRRRAARVAGRRGGGADAAPRAPARGGARPEPHRRHRLRRPLPARVAGVRGRARLAPGGDGRAAACSDFVHPDDVDRDRARASTGIAGGYRGRRLRVPLPQQGRQLPLAALELAGRAARAALLQRGQGHHRPQAQRARPARVARRATGCSPRTPPT